MPLRVALPLAGFLLGAFIAPARAQTARTTETEARQEADRREADRAKTARREAEREDKERRPEVRELRLLGVKSLNASELKKALVTQQSSCVALLYKPICAAGITSPYFFEHRYLDQAEFQREVIRLLVFYFRRGYRDARVDTSVVRISDNKVRVTMSVTEGPPTLVDSVRVEGTGQVLPERDTIREVRPEKGQPLNLVALDSSVTRMRGRVWERGYVDAVFKLTTAVNDTSRT